MKNKKFYPLTLIDDNNIIGHLIIRNPKNEYHKFNEFIYNFVKDDFENYISFEEYLKNNENDLCIIEYNGKTIGFFNKNVLDKIYLLEEYSDKNIDEDIRSKVKK